MFYKQVKSVHSHLTIGLFSDVINIVLSLNKSIHVHQPFIKLYGFNDCIRKYA